MATYNEHIYAIKNILNKGVASDDSRITNRLIGHYLKQSRALLIKRRLDKYNHISHLNYNTICVPLETSNYHDCNCIPDRFNCKILKSTCSIPQELVTNWGSTLVIKYADGRQMSRTNITRDNLTKYSLSQKETADQGWFLENGYLYILNSDKLSVVLLTLLASDPESVSNFCTCAPTSESQPCYDLNNDEFPIDGDLVMPMYEMTRNFILESFKLPEDNENNSKSVEIINEREN